ncbi:hypothetical protein Ancab_002388, partial [Ancistrocladus abbreviatus]
QIWVGTFRLRVEFARKPVTSSGSQQQGVDINKAGTRRPLAVLRGGRSYKDVVESSSKGTIEKKGMQDPHGSRDQASGMAPKGNGNETSASPEASPGHFITGSHLAGPGVPKWPAKDKAQYNARKTPKGPKNQNPI